MELLNINNEAVLKKMPYLKGKIRDNFGDKAVSLYSFIDNSELGFIIMCVGRGLLIKSDGSSIKFKKSFTGALSELEKNEYLIKPRVEYEMEDDCITTTDVSLKDKEGVVSSLSILPSYNEDVYRSRVCYSQYIEDNDVYCEINYDYSSDDIIYPGLLKNIESVHIIRDANRKGISCGSGFVPNRMQIYSRANIDSDTLNYTFVSFNEHGVFNTLMNGSYQLFNGAGYITRYCKLGFMTSSRQLVELPWPLCNYIKEEDILEWITNNGFRNSIPEELINLYNNNDKDVILLQDFLANLDKYKNNNKVRKYLRIKK